MKWKACECFIEKGRKGPHKKYETIWCYDAISEKIRCQLMCEYTVRQAPGGMDPRISTRFHYASMTVSNKRGIVCTLSSLHLNRHLVDENLVVR